MVQASDVVRYCEELLSPAEFRDYAPNGLQVEGERPVRRIVSAVTATANVLERAQAETADLVLVHHGYFWKGEDPRIVGMKAARLRRLLLSGMSLVAYHLPLDAHATLGNNACLAERLGLTVTARHAVGGIPGLLWEGELAGPEPLERFVERVRSVLGRAPLLVGAGPAHIARVAWCTGAAQGFLADASALGVDLYLSGEVSERTTHEARELDIHYLAAGHHATERYGVQALGQRLASVFGVEHRYMDDDNPV